MIFEEKYVSNIFIFIRNQIRYSLMAPAIRFATNLLKDKTKAKSIVKFYENEGIVEKIFSLLEKPFRIFNETIRKFISAYLENSPESSLISFIDTKKLDLIRSAVNSNGPVSDEICILFTKILSLCPKKVLGSLLTPLIYSFFTSTLKMSKNVQCLSEILKVIGLFFENGRKEFEGNETLVEEVERLTGHQNILVSEAAEEFMEKYFGEGEKMDMDDKIGEEVEIQFFQKTTEKVRPKNSKTVSLGLQIAKNQIARSIMCP